VFWSSQLVSFAHAFPDPRSKKLLSSNSFRIRTYRSVCKQTTLSPFRFRTYAKSGGGVPSLNPLNSQILANRAWPVHPVPPHTETGRQPVGTFFPSTSVLHSKRFILNLLSYCSAAPPQIHWPFNSGGFPLTGSERRTTQRFSMRLPLTVRWTTGAAVGETSTESRDVSSRGVYFYLAKDVKEGSAVEILLTLPNEITLAGPVRVRCLGRVQRTEPRDDSSVGVVAAIERYEFLRGDDDN